MNHTQRDLLHRLVEDAYTPAEKIEAVAAQAHLKDLALQKSGRPSMGPGQNPALPNLLRDTLSAAVALSVLDKETHGPALRPQIESVAARILSVPQGFSTEPQDALFETAKGQAVSHLRAATFLWKGEETNQGFEILSTFQELKGRHRTLDVPAPVMKEIAAELRAIGSK